MTSSEKEIRRWDPGRCPGRRDPPRPTSLEPFLSRMPSTGFFSPAGPPAAGLELFRPTSDAKGSDEPLLIAAGSFFSWAYFKEQDQRSKPAWHVADGVQNKVERDQK